MVKNSLKNMINKYPYFMDSNPNSNFYKVTKAYNENFIELYNNLFHVYESFHLNKKLVIWKEQSEDYAYKINFHCGFPNIKNIRIYKNDILIHKEEFIEKENKTDYEWVYDCFYAKTNMLRLKVFKCNYCDEIYFGDNLPYTCTTCNHHEGYHKVKIYQCNNCEEIYFDTEPPEACKTSTCNNNTMEDYTELYVYKCVNCGEIYLSDDFPDKCKICGTETILENTDLYYNDERVMVFDNSTDYTEEILLTDEDIDSVNPYLTLRSEYSYAYKCNDCGEITPTNTLQSNCPKCNSTNITDYTDEFFATEYSTEDEFNLRLPVIPNDRFLFYVETWDEYYKVKGFPENDTYLNDDYDHDYSLDSFGALNNIPRKEYIPVDEIEDYPYTEPPYNDCLTEDDYHYMKRILEFTTRMWISLNDIPKDSDEYINYSMNPRNFTEKYNPTTLELWKNYSIESRLINRERYLLKLFDINKHNALQNRYDNALDDGTWTPELWEHKDKFCNDILLYDKFFYAYTDNLRPVKWEDVEFKFGIENSIAEKIDTYPFLIDIYRFVDGDCKKILINNGATDNVQATVWHDCNISYKEIVLTKPSTFRFIAHEWNTSILPDGTNIQTNQEALKLIKDKEALNKLDDVIGVVDITLNPKDCENADWYVKNNVSSSGNGTKSSPFKTLNEALEHVREGYDVICLLSNVNFEKPFIVDKNCKIIGCHDANDKVPVLNNITDGSDFFKLTGGKNISLKLIDLRLKNLKYDNYVGSGRWTNNNVNLNDYNTVIIRGGLVLLNAEIVGVNSFYPTDNVHIKATLTNKDGSVIKDETIVISYKDNEVVRLVTDSNGMIDYVFKLNETVNGIYPLYMSIDSDNYFGTEEVLNIKADKVPETIQSNGSNVHITVNVQPGGTYYVYVDGELVATITDSDGDGVIEYDYMPDWGTHMITIVDSEGNIIHEIIVTTVVDLSKLIGKTFITDFEIVTEDTVNGGNISNVNYNTITISNNPKLGDLDGILYILKLVGDNIVYTNYTVDEERMNATDIWYSEAVPLSNCVTSVSYNVETSEISYTTLGKFWQE